MDVRRSEAVALALGGGGVSVYPPFSSVRIFAFIEDAQLLKLGLSLMSNLVNVYQ